MEHVDSFNINIDLLSAAVTLPYDYTFIPLTNYDNFTHVKVKTVSYFIDGSTDNNAFSGVVLVRAGFISSTDKTLCTVANLKATKPYVNIGNHNILKKAIAPINQQVNIQLATAYTPANPVTFQGVISISIELLREKSALKIYQEDVRTPTFSATIPITPKTASKLRIKDFTG